MIQLDGGTTLIKTDATTSDLGIDVLIDTAKINVLAGKLMGDFQGAGSLAVAAGATLVLGGSGVQVAPPAADVAGGTIEVEPDADVSLVLPASLRSTGSPSAPAPRSTSASTTAARPAGGAPPNALGVEVGIAAGATLSITAGGGLLGSRRMTSSAAPVRSMPRSRTAAAPRAERRAARHRQYTQGAGRRSRSNSAAPLTRTLRVGGAAALAGTLAVTTKYTPAKAASQLVLGAASKPAGTFAKLLAPLSAGLAWDPAYGATGVAARRHRWGRRTGVADAAVAAAGRSLVGGRTRCLPGKWTGARPLTYEWLRGASRSRTRTQFRRVTPADRGRALACRVTAVATGGARAAAASKAARVRAGLDIGAVTARPGGAVSVALGCPANERTCRGSLRVLVAGHASRAATFRALAGRRGEAGGGRLGGTARRCRGRARELPQCQGGRARDEEPEYLPR